MTKAILFLLWAMLNSLTASATDGTGFKAAYFGATKVGAWARYSMKIEGQVDMGIVKTRVPDASGQQGVEVRSEYMVQGKLSQAQTNFVMKAGYSLEVDALGYGKALVAMRTSVPGAQGAPLPAAAVAGAGKAMPDYAAHVRFVGTETVADKATDHYQYVLPPTGTPAQIETGDLWLNASVPFGLVRQRATTKDTAGKVMSKTEMLLTANGTNANATKAPEVRTGPASVVLAEAFKTGRVELHVTVLPTSVEGKNLRIVFKNKSDAPLRLTIPAGITLLEAGMPLEQMRLEAAASTTLDMEPAASSAPVELTQSGARRAIRGSFAISVFEGNPLYSGSATVATVKP